MLRCAVSAQSPFDGLGGYFRLVPFDGEWIILTGVHGGKE
jgi:hypothetical protein